MPLIILFLIIKIFISFNSPASVLINEDFDSTPVGLFQSSSNWTFIGNSPMVQSNIAKNINSIDLNNSYLSNNLNSTQNMFWCSFWLNSNKITTNNLININESSSVVFYINESHQIVAFSNNIPVNTEFSISTNTWSRFDIFCDYEEMKWNLGINGTNILSGYSFYSNSPGVSSFLISNNSNHSIYLDNILLSENELISIVSDFDNDLIPDWWEYKYFGNITNAISTEENLHAYIAGLVPGEKFEIYNYPIEWVNKPGRYYTVYATSNLLNEFILQTNLYGEINSFNDFMNVNVDSMFYKVEVNINQDEL